MDNEILENMLLGAILGMMEKSKPKQVLHAEIQDLGAGIAVIIGVKKDFEKILTDEETEILNEAVNTLGKAFEKITDGNEAVRTYLRAEKEHDCENCPEEIKRECQDLKKNINDELKEAVMNMSNKTKEMN